MLLIRSVQIFSNFILIFRTFSITHPCIHSFATSMNFIWFLTILFHLLLSTKITSTQGNTFFLILFGAEFANTFPRIMPGVETRAMYEIIVSHALGQGICALNHTILASPPQCLTVTEGGWVPLFFFWTVFSWKPVDNQIGNSYCNIYCLTVTEGIIK